MPYVLKPGEKEYQGFVIDATGAAYAKWPDGSLVTHDQVVQAPVAPTVPTLPPMPQAPQVPMAPALPPMPQMPQAPTAPMMPQAPQLPSAPVAPNVPALPSLPGSAQAPAASAPSKESLVALQTSLKKSLKAAEEMEDVIGTNKEMLTVGLNIVNQMLGEPVSNTAAPASEAKATAVADDPTKDNEKQKNFRNFANFRFQTQQGPMTKDAFRTMFLDDASEDDLKVYCNIVNALKIGKAATQPIEYTSFKASTFGKSARMQLTKTVFPS